MTPDPVSIGRYRILGELGRGAMGQVYLAEDPLLKRGLAIKVVKAELEEKEEVLARFRREAEISAQLNHPNIVTIFDVGDEAEQGLFLAMEFIEGSSLHELLKSGPLPPDQAVVLLVQAMGALEAAHRAGIIHRDFKPANLMVDREGRLKLMDFGIARRQESQLTATGLLCTPAYAAPELLSGEAPSVSSDRWAFSITAFECLTSVLPFQAPNLSSLLFAIAKGEAVFPDHMNEALKDVFRKALQTEPSHRFPDLRSFLEALILALPLHPSVQDTARSLLYTTLSLPPLSVRLSDAPATLDRLASPEVQTLQPQIKKVQAVSRLRWTWLVGASLVLGLAILGLLSAGYGRSRELELVSLPPGAEVFIDDEKCGTTPLKLPVPLRARILRLEKQGFATVIRSVPKDQDKLEIVLQSAPFWVSVKSEPVGAEVLLNGKSVGQTPLTRLLIPGEGQHKLGLKLSGYETWTMLVSHDRRPPDQVQLRKPKKREEPNFFKRLFGADRNK